MEKDNLDIRWEQRFSNYQKALSRLQQFIDKGELSIFEEQGLIKAFEYTYELAWSTIKDYLEFQGKVDLIGARDSFREAFKVGLIEDETWMDMIQSRNKTTHTYNEEIAKEVREVVVNEYYQLFKQLEQRMLKLLSN